MKEKWKENFKYDKKYLSKIKKINEFMQPL